MSTKAKLAVCILCLLWILPAAAPAEAGQDWPRYRGPEQTGSSSGSALLERDAFGLAVSWKRPLGSGYSSVLVAEGLGVTMFTDGSDDYLCAFDPATGEERWRYKVGEMYEGHGGSDDGPRSTPAVAGGTVYALGPRGRLVAVRLADGVELWSRTFSESEARAPYMGFVTSPLVVGEHVVVQTGGAGGHSITAFDRATGEPRWSRGDDTVNYQSPALLTLGGREQIVAMSDTYLTGLDPSDGTVLWRHEHKTSAYEAFAHPQAIGKDRLLVNSPREVAMFRLAPEDDGFAVEELWRSRALWVSYAVPVYHEGYLYGFYRSFLTCVDAATGEVRWRSRPPGGRGLILVDSQLVLLGADGDLVVVEASPQGYRERARLPVLERGYMTAPSFADGSFYVRNLEEMAAVRLTDEPRVAVSERELLGEWGDLVRRVEAAAEAERSGLVEAYLAAQESFPIVEGDGLVHFVFQGEIEDVALAGNFLRWREELAMDRIAGTDVYWKSLELDPEAVWEYGYAIDFGQPVPDPKNPHRIGTWGVRSVLRMPGSQVPLEVAEVEEGRRGRLDSFQFRSDVLKDERRVRLYLPPRYARPHEAHEGDPSGDEVYPLLVVLEPLGDGALESGYMDRFLDRLIADGKMAPVVALFVYGLDPPDRFVRMLTEELLPHIEKHYRVDPSSRTALGVFDGTAAALHATLRVPGTFRRIVMQSFFASTSLSEGLPALVRKSQEQDLEILLETRRHPLDVPNRDMTEPLARLIGALEEKGHTVHRRQVVGSWGWVSWRAQWDEILPRLFPPATEGESGAH